MKSKLVPGMLTTDGRVRAATDDGRVTVIDDDGCRTTGQAEAFKVVFTDRATYHLAKDELAKRVGLDPADGVLWYRAARDATIMSASGNTERSFWLLQTDPHGFLEGTRRFDIDTDDPIVALQAALDATEEVRGE